MEKGIAPNNQNGRIGQIDYSRQRFTPGMVHASPS
jgi:hypothetical protein